MIQADRSDKSQIKLKEVRGEAGVTASSKVSLADGRASGSVSGACNGIELYVRAGLDYGKDGDRSISWAGSSLLTQTHVRQKS